MKISNEIISNTSDMLTKGLGSTSKRAGSEPRFHYPDNLKLNDPKSLPKETKDNRVCWSKSRSKFCAMKVVYKNKTDLGVKDSILVFNEFYGERVNKHSKRKMCINIPSYRQVLISEMESRLISLCMIMQHVFRTEKEDRFFRNVKNSSGKYT